MKAVIRFVSIISLMALVAACGENPHVLGSDPTLRSPSSPNNPTPVDPDGTDHGKNPGQEGGKYCGIAVLYELSHRALQSGESGFVAKDQQGLGFDISLPAQKNPTLIQGAYLWIFGTAIGEGQKEVEVCVPQVSACTQFDARYVTQDIRRIDLSSIFAEQKLLEFVNESKTLVVTVSNNVQIDRSSLQLERLSNEDCPEQKPEPKPTGKE